MIGTDHRGCDSWSGNPYCRSRVHRSFDEAKTIGFTIVVSRVAPKVKGAHTIFQAIFSTGKVFATHVAPRVAVRTGAVPVLSTWRLGGNESDGEAEGDDLDRSYPGLVG